MGGGKDVKRRERECQKGRSGKKSEKGWENEKRSEKGWEMEKERVGER